MISVLPSGERSRPQVADHVCCMATGCSECLSVVLAQRRLHSIFGSQECNASKTCCRQLGLHSRVLLLFEIVVVLYDSGCCRSRNAPHSVLQPLALP